MQSILLFFHRCLLNILLLMFGLMVIVIIWQVFSRFVLDSAPVWSEELTRYMLVWVTLLGSAYVMHDKNGHIAVTFFADMLPPKFQTFLSVIRCISTYIMAAALTYYGYQHALLGERRISTGLNITMDYAYFSIPIGGALIAFFLTLDLLTKKGAKT
ncbi:TRAP transporter small permease [Halomonas sp. QX-2]|uniref:TRAP transporter small permease protein n=1 Tax=Vreelandella sedimenti TaxID=2729618 RepID=A0A7Z0N9P8_9GAMM|nr:TRAP transporter small permease [Halomonas sedimenti]NYT73744.1 TRAP transporter small permease [Halomonas sedimenti]